MRLVVVKETDLKRRRLLSAGRQQISRRDMPIPYHGLDRSGCCNAAAGRNGRFSGLFDCASEVESRAVAMGACMHLQRCPCNLKILSLYYGAAFSDLCSEIHFEASVSCEALT